MDTDTKQLKLHTRLEGAKHLSKRNINKILARCTIATDRMGNRLDKHGNSPIDYLRGEQPYHQFYRVRLEPEGYIFREVNNHNGISGHHPTLRALVISALTFAHITVEVEGQ